MSFRPAVTSAIIFLLGSFVGWQGHRLSKQTKVLSGMLSEQDRRERQFREMADDYDPDSIKQQKHEAKGILLGQLVLNEIRAWIRENAKVDPEPLKVEIAFWPPDVKDWGAGPTMRFEIYLSRNITNPQQVELQARVNDMLRTSLVQAARLNRLYLHGASLYISGIKQHPEHAEWLKLNLELDRRAFDPDEIDTLQDYTPK